MDIQNKQKTLKPLASFFRALKLELKLIFLVIVLLYNSIFAIEAGTLTSLKYPKPFLADEQSSYSINFHSDGDVLRLIQILEIYPLLLYRLDEIEKEWLFLENSLEESEILLDDSLLALKKKQKQESFYRSLSVGLAILLPIVFGLGIYAGLYIPR